MEYRSFQLADAEVSKNGRDFRGRAVVYDQPSPLRSMDGKTIQESIKRGAFAETTVPLFREHRPELLLASRSVKLTHGQGLDIEAELLATQAGNEASELISAGELRGLSIGFLPLGTPSGWRWERRGEEVHRSLTSGKLFEISLVALPVHEGTYAQVRSISVPENVGNRKNQAWGKLLDALSA